MLLNARPLNTDARDAPKRILLAIDDITEGKQLEACAFPKFAIGVFSKRPQRGCLSWTPVHTELRTPIRS